MARSTTFLDTMESLFSGISVGSLQIKMNGGLHCHYRLRKSRGDGGYEVEQLGDSIPLPRSLGGCQVSKQNDSGSAGCNS